MTCRHAQVVSLEKEAAGIKYMVPFDNYDDFFNPYIHKPYVCKQCSCKSMNKDMEGYNARYRKRSCKEGNEVNLGKLLKNENKQEIHSTP